MYRHLAAGGVPLLKSNPFASLGNAVPRRRSQPVQKPTLDECVVARALERIACEPKTTAIEHQRAWRDRFLLTILSRTPLNTADLAKARMSDLKVTAMEASDAKWSLVVKCRGEVRLDAEVVDVLEHSRRAFSLRPIPSADEPWGLVLSPYTGAACGGAEQSSARARRSRSSGKRSRCAKRSGRSWKLLSIHRRHKKAARGRLDVCKGGWRQVERNLACSQHA